MFGRRPDATLAKDVPAIRRFMPFISPRRNESLVYFDQECEVEVALAFVERVNETRPPDRPITLFHVAMQAICQAIHERPRLNRFIAGGRIWQRDGLWVSFSAKVRIDDDSPLITVKREWEPDDGLFVTVDKIHDGLTTGRSGKKSTSDKEMSILLRLPPFFARFFVWVAMKLDDLGLLPKAMIDADPLHASIFIANLGSVGLESGYHHLWEYGNIPFFAVLGRIRGPEGARTVSIKYSYDERVEDGLYAGRVLARIRELIAKPEEL